MNLIKLMEIKVPDNFSLRQSQDGRYMAFIGSTGFLEVIELEPQSNKLMSKYVLDDPSMLRNHQQVAFFEDYVVVVIQNSQSTAGTERYLQFIRFDFRIGSSKQFRLSLPNLDWNNNHRQKVNFYPGLPETIGNTFETDFIYYADEELKTIFDTDKIVLEQRYGQYQLIDVSGTPKVLLSYRGQVPSPFTLPYVFKQHKQQFRILKYKQGRYSSSNLWIVDTFVRLQVLNDSIFLIQQNYKHSILMKSKKKTLRMFINNETPYYHGQYIIMNSANMEQTLRIDILTAEQYTIPNKGVATMIGKYLFQSTLIPNQSTLKSITVSRFQ